RGAQTWTVSMRNDIDAALDLERRICAFLDAPIVPFRQAFGYSHAALAKLLRALGNWGPVGTSLRFPSHSIDMSEAFRLRL
ncbi:dihydrodipicolinate synthase family protein, partial [Rhizobium johnstonii]